MNPELAEALLIGAIYEGIVEIPGWGIFLDRVKDAFGVAVASILIQVETIRVLQNICSCFRKAAAASLRDQIDAFSAETIFV